ncbi:MAG: GTP pyrophosphokinase family protein [Lachnospiraceae bacterium]|nr:GTP pyrophosphokinase family protein [Lachnospiraceae bacterium]
MDNRLEYTLSREQFDKFEEMAVPFQKLMMQYECAMLEVRTKLEVLNKELSLLHSRNPFESIKSRLKSPESIYGKLQRNGQDFTIENIRENLNDIAGIRVICSFTEDIYMLADCLVAQDDITLIEKKDYIADPKPNGYRSLHLILDIPIFMTDEKKHRRVEVQLRTIAMDFWASLEHKMKYKKDIENAEGISEELKYCAEIISQLDRRMEQICKRIDKKELYSQTGILRTDLE